MVTALGPGTTVTGRPASTTARTRRAPGSLTSGMPASLTSATRAPSRRRRTMSAARPASLCRWSATIGTSAPACRRSVAVRRVSSHATRSAVAQVSRRPRAQIVEVADRRPHHRAGHPPPPRRPLPVFGRSRRVGRYHCPPMSRTTKPYRRFRARGTAEEIDGEDGLAELRALNERESGGAGAPPPDARRPPDARAARAAPRPPRAPAAARAPARGPQPLVVARARPGRLGGAHRDPLPRAAGRVGGPRLHRAERRGEGGERQDHAPGPRRPRPAPGGMLGTPTNTLILGVDARRARRAASARTRS